MLVRSRHLLYLCVLCLVAGGLLGACGQKGPLYLPEPEPDEQVDKAGS